MVNQKLVKENLQSFSVDILKLLLEQSEKKYNTLLADDTALRSRIQSINAISIGLVVLLVSIIHNKDWYEEAMNYFIVLVVFLIYNAIIFFLTLIMKPTIGGWTVDQLVPNIISIDPVGDQLRAAYTLRTLYYENESRILIKKVRIIRTIFLSATILFGFMIVIFYYIKYWT